MQYRHAMNMVFFTGVLMLSGWLSACTSIHHNYQSEADIEAMQKYADLSELLERRMVRLNLAISIDTANAELLAQRETLRARKKEVDYFYEVARKSAIENGEIGARTSPLIKFMKK